MTDKFECPRKRTDCTPIELMASDCGGSFTCTGFNDGTTRNHEQDIFTHCWKSEGTDDMNHMDTRDFVHTIFVMSSALAYNENLLAIEVRDKEND